MSSLDVSAMRADANRLIDYMSPVSRALTDERTSLESKLIPVSAYIVTAAVEAWYRYPELMRRIDAARPAEELGRSGRRPGSRINSVHLWSIANFWLLGRKVMCGIDPSLDRVEPAYEVLHFWERAALAFRGDDGTRQAWDTGDARPYGESVIAQLLDNAAPVDAGERESIKRFNATLVAYLFLLYFDTRVGTGDTGAYPVPGEPGRVLLVRDYYQMGESDFWWSSVARDVPYQNLTAALVLDDVRVRITDFGSSYTEPDDYLDRLVRFGLYTTDGGELRPVPVGDIDGIIAAVRKAQAAHYRNIVAMDRHEKIRCGAYVYFSFLRPFAIAAGIADELDWTVPRDIPPPIYDFVSQLEGTNTGVAEEGPYYAPLA